MSRKHVHQSHQASDEYREKAWVGGIIFVILFLAFCMVLDATFDDKPPDGIEQPDDGCSSGVPQMGCFP